MKRGKALVIKSTERDYRVLDASRRPVPGVFTRDEAVAKAKAEEAWMKEQGFPRGTKHYVIYQPTGENVPFEGAVMAKRRRRRVNFGAPPSVHAKRAKWLWANLRQKSETARAQAEAGKCDLALLNYEDAVYYRGALDEQLSSIGRHRYAFERAMGHGSDLRRAQIAARKALEMHCGR